MNKSKAFVFLVGVSCALLGCFALPVDELANEVTSSEEVKTADDISYLGSTVFGTPSEETGSIVAEYNFEDPDGPNPEELGEYAEGDILFPGESRNGLIAETYRWPGAVVPYVFSGKWASKDKDTVKLAMEEYHKHTCIKFRPRKPGKDKDYIRFINNHTGCFSSVGRIGGGQRINLQSSNCISKIGTPIHEIMHALGFGHEQSRYERDKFVQINFENIKETHVKNFKKAAKNKTSGFGVPYDFGSVMHYSAKAFSKNGKVTIKAKVKNTQKMGQRKGLSPGDIKKLNNMYCK